MKRGYGLLIIGLLMISEYGQTESLWTVVDEVDPFTDEEIKAVVYEDDTHRIQINMETEDAIAMYLGLNRATFESNTILELRVDKNPMLEFQPMSDSLNEALIGMLGMPAYRWTPSTLVIFFASIAGLNPTAPEDIESATNSCDGAMVQFINGESLIGRYYVTDTSRQTLRVSLEGFKEAANQVFEIAEMHNDNPHCLR